MTLAEWANLATVVSALVVIISIPPLIISVRQNTRAQKTATVDSLAAAIAAINIPATEGPELGLALRACLSDWFDSTKEQRIIAHYFLFSYFKLHENAFYQHRSGILDDELWDGWQSSAQKYFHATGVKEVWWPNRHGAFSEPFRDFLEATSHPNSTISDLGLLFDEPESKTDGTA